MQGIQEKQSRAKAGVWSQGVAHVLAGVEKTATYVTIRETALVEKRLLISRSSW